jgi:hypothetical protein
MSESEFAKSLLCGEDPIDVPALTSRVLRRDRRRIWVLGTLCILAWMAVVMIPWALILPMMAKVVLYQKNLDRGGPPNREQLMDMLRVLKAGTIATFLSSIGCMFVAAVCTVLLIVLSRRATLRQVNARLAEISAELRAQAGRMPRGDV